MALKQYLTWMLFVFSCLAISAGSGHANQLSNTKQQLVQLSNKIRHTESSINQAKQKRSTLQKQLGLHERKIGQLILQKKRLYKQIKINNKTIIDLSRQIKALDEQIEQEQLALAKHIRSRYMIDVHQPLKWLLSPGSKDELSQILTYYQYIIRTQQASIESIAAQTKQLNEKKLELSSRITQDKSMHINLAQKQKELVSTQVKQKQVINNLNQSITSKSQQLKEFKDNQAGLGRIVAKLSKQDRIAQSKPFISRRHHLPRPVSVTIKAIKPIHQGLAFFAQEGTSVKAIHPGKVLFSDWLKGYGLLLIIDHGHGYLTLYAHNQALTKQKGDWVEGGEKIAEVGHSGGLRENGLYFEIRHNGKAISPINWLS